jgi:phage terminase small subunit
MPRKNNPRTARQSRFIEEFVIDSDDTNAARRAGYSERRHTRSDTNCSGNL